ncbi:InlB B-repeat-containing protein [Candidatus Methanomassiliicoccus intestinalis]|uniref:InlB B-repeat-containing protein n=1 Tax=Candidatus Methanomassiliicoccus intestinalis TaxID=1406512 RepID=UPI0037DC6380
MSRKLSMAIVILIVAVIVIGVAVYYVASDDDTKDTYRLSFESNGGSTLSSMEVDKTSPVIAPADPTKPGSEFIGWYTDEGLTAPFAFNQPPSESLTLYAKWAPVLELDEDEFEQAINDPDNITYVFGDGTQESIAINGSDLLKLIYSDLETLTLKTSNGYVVVDLEDLQDDVKLTNDSVLRFSISVGNKSALTAEEADIIGDRPFYNVIFSIDKISVTDPGDFITLYLNYNLQNGENPSKLEVYVISSDGSVSKIDTDYLASMNLIECDPDHFSYFIITYDGLQWPNMFGLNIPPASERVDEYFQSNILNGFADYLPDELPQEVLKYFDFTKFDWEIQSATVEDYSQARYDEYVKSIEASGFTKSPVFSSLLQASEDDNSFWVGTKTVGGVDYLIFIDLSTDDGFADELSVSLINFDPLKELGISINDLTGPSANWIDQLAGFQIPEPYVNAGYETYADLSFHGSALADLISDIIVEKNLTPEEQAELDAGLKVLNSIQGNIGYLELIAPYSKLTPDVIAQEINSIQEKNGLKYVNLLFDEDGITSPVVLTKTLKVVDGQLTFEDLIIISWSPVYFADLYELNIIAIDSAFTLDIGALEIPGIALNKLLFGEAWEETVAGCQLPVPFEGATANVLIDLSINSDALLASLKSMIAEYNLDPDLIESLEESLASLYGLNGDLGMVSLANEKLTHSSVNEYVQKLTEANSGFIKVIDESDDSEHLWVLTKSDFATGTVECIIQISWVAFQMNGVDNYSIGITILNNHSDL